MLQTMNVTPPPPVSLVTACAQRYPHPPPGGGGGGIPKVTPPRGNRKDRDTRKSMQTQGYMSHKKTQKLPVGMDVQLY